MKKAAEAAVILVFVIVMRRSRCTVVGVLLGVIMGMAVHQISMTVFMLMLDHCGRALAPQTTATFTHINLHV